MPVTILLVDDDPDGRFLTERRLRKFFADSTLIACSSADEAVLQLDGKQIDAVVTDNKLGRQSGCDFIRHVREAQITCPVVMVTCSDDPDVERDAYRAGASKVFRTGSDDFAVFLKARLAPPDDPSPRIGR